MRIKVLSVFDSVLLNMNICNIITMEINYFNLVEFKYGNGYLSNLGIEFGPLTLLAV